MKKLLILVVCLVGFTAFSQNKNQKTTIEVDGVCMMCKKRIEKAAIRTKGVKSAVWDVKTHQLALIFDERKTDIKTIEKNIAAVGHDTKSAKATDKAYNSVDPCCKYRDEEVVKNHN